MYDCTVKTIDELVIDDDFSSAPSQERSVDDGFQMTEMNKTSAKTLITANNAHAKRSLHSSARERENVKSELMNCCSTNTKNSNKVKCVSRGSSYLKRFLFRDSNLVISGDNVTTCNKNEDIQMEPVQAQAIIFHVEEKSQCKQVSL